MSPKLAIQGGPKTRNQPFPAYPIVGDPEREAVLEVLNEGRFSTFIAAPGEHFLGGRRIRSFEQEFAQYHGVRFAVAFNSATAALHAAVAAAGVQPGQEVITTPYTFTSSATCALMHNAIPVFADVDPKTFCLNPEATKAAISPLTKAILPVHLFGHPADLDAFLKLARQHSLRIIEDCAQAPGALYKGKKVGTLGDCGIFSFQESKNMMTGEGGMLITNDESIAEIARLIRNHGETITETLENRSYRSEILGWGYRMTEFEAALGRVQLRQLETWNAHRRRLAQFLNQYLRDIPGLSPQTPQPGCDHVYYVYPLLYEEKETGIPRNLFVEALKAEGIPSNAGYIKPLYLSPLYQERRAFAFRHYRGEASYAPGLCPVAEKLHFQQMLLIPACRPPASEQDMLDIVYAIRKILDHKEELLTPAPQTATISR